MKRVVCIWFPQWASQREAVAPPGLKDATDRERLELLAEQCRRYSPIVGVDPSPQPDSLFLDLTGLAHLYPGESALAQEILQRLAEQGLAARLAIADTLGAAWAVGRAPGVRRAPGVSPGVKKGKLQIDHCKLQIANQEASSPQFAICNCQLPICNSSSYTIVPPHQTLPALAPLSVALLRIPEEAVELLAQLGIHQIGQIERLPREDLPSRFGPEVLRRLDQALGRADERLPAQKAPPELCARESFEYPTTDRVFLEQALRRLIDHLAERLIEHGLGALRLECVLVCPPAEPLRISVGLFQASTSGAHLFGLVEMQLERRTLAEPVTAIEIEVPAHARLERRQQELFSDVPPERHPRHLAALVDRLANRLGRWSVGRPRLVPDAQPELAYTYDPLVEEKKGTVPICAKRLPGHLPEKLPPRPLRLFRRPVPLEVISVPPDGPPAQLRLRGRRHEIAESWGPERIETGWWRNRPVERDYYRIETAEGQRYWIFRRLSDGRWFAHGSFE